MTEHSSGRAVAAAHRTVRSLAEGEGPFAGDLVTHGEGISVCVDAAQLVGWPGWRFAGAEHVAAPRDLALRSDGQDVLLPWCVRLGDAYLAQRAAGRVLSNGEAVTLAVSVLRGLAELSTGASNSGRQEREDELTGRWWLTDDARPLFVIGEGDAPLRESERLLEALQAQIEDRALCRVLARLHAALEEPRRLHAEFARWEQELLDIAAPRPLRADDGGDPAWTAHGVQAAHSAERRLRRRDLRDSGPERGANGWIRVLGAWVGELCRGLLVLVGRVERVPRVSRRGTLGKAAAKVGARKRWAGPAVVAVAVALVVAVSGAVWPSGTGAPAADAADRRPTLSPSPSGSVTPGPSPTEAPTPSATPSATPARDPAPSRQQDPLLAAAELITSARQCRMASVSTCATLWDGGESAARTVRGDAEGPVLIEDYGDVAAVRNPVDDGAQMVVIIRRDDEWRIRDVYDIADPPSEGAGGPG